MPFCFVPQCGHDSRRDTCRFFRFPKKEKDFTKWKKLCRRGDKEPGSEDRVCSCHFINGNKNAGPTVFAWNIAKKMNFTSPEKKKKPSNASGSESNTSLPSPNVTAPCTVRPEEVLEPSSGSEVSQGTSNFSEVSQGSLPLPSNAVLSAELYFLQQENENLKKQLALGENRMTFQSICNTDATVFEYTGVPSTAHFKILENLLKRFELKNYLGWKVEVLNLSDQLLMCLMKLRLNLRLFDLAHRFKVCKTTVHNVVITLMYALHEILFVGIMDKIPSREKNCYFLPQCFTQFPNCRIVLDCTEIEVAIPKPLNEQKLIFSHYKQRHTFKALVGVSPNGTIIFTSALYPGSMSDKAITKESGILDQLTAGDFILADKGFLINDLCRERGITVNIPPFLTNPQFTVEEALLTRKIARARIHVERAISRLKNFRILDFIRHDMREHSTVILQTCAALVNIQHSLLKENEQFFPSVCS